MQQLYEFDCYQVDFERRLLFRGGEVVQLPSKALDTLLVLIQHRGEVVCKDKLMKLVWPDSFVEEGNLSQNVHVLRKALGEGVGEHRYILTVPGRGYRFVAKVVEYPRAGKEASRETAAGDPSIATEPVAFSAALQDLRRQLLAAKTLPELTSLRYQVESLIDQNQGQPPIPEARLLLDNINSALDYWLPDLPDFASSWSRARHPVSLEAAPGVFDDPDALSLADGSGRWRTVGKVLGNVVLVVDHVVSEVGGKEIVRIIGARKATRGERRSYEQKKRPAD